MKLVKRWLGLEIVFVHAGHGLLFAAAFAVVASQAPWWSLLLALPLVLFSALFWLYESAFVLPTAARLLRGDANGTKTGAGEAP
ncbi:MAG: hypothetical protein Q7T33_04190 [Dehalococcoidia bacterium]|nr:hypothetical protein [Dehalococcoidia bacterium]